MGSCPSPAICPWLRPVRCSPAQCEVLELVPPERLVYSMGRGRCRHTAQPGIKHSHVSERDLGSHTLTPPTPRMIAGKILEVEIGRCKQSSITVTVLRTYSN